MTNLPFYQFLDQTPLALTLLGCLAVAAVLGFTGAPLAVWTLVGAAIIFIGTWQLAKREGRH